MNKKNLPSILVGHKIFVEVLNWIEFPVLVNAIV